MKIEYERCDFCGKKIDGRFTGHYKYQLVSYISSFDVEHPNGPVSVDVCQNCLGILNEFAKKRSRFDWGKI